MRRRPRHRTPVAGLLLGPSAVLDLPATLASVDWTPLHVLVSLASQHEAVDQLQNAGLTSLESILMSAVGALSATVTGLFAWANRIRVSSAALLDERQKELTALTDKWQGLYTELVKQSIADNKDILHALQDVSKTMDRISEKLEKKDP